MHPKIVKTESVYICAQMIKTDVLTEWPSTWDEMNKSAFSAYRLNSVDAVVGLIYHMVQCQSASLLRFLSQLKNNKNFRVIVVTL